MNEIENTLTAIGAFLAGILGALGAFLLSRSKANAKIITTRGEAHKHHAEAGVQEAQARLILDEATRDWGSKLIEKFDAENEELRNEIRTLRECYRVEIEQIRADGERAKIDVEQRYKLRIEQMQTEIDALRESYRIEIEQLRTEHERAKIDIEERYKLRIEQMQAEIDSLRVQNVELLALVRSKKSAGYL